MKELWIDGHFIEVTDEVYAAYVKGQRKIDYFEKDLKTERVIKEKDGSIKEIVPSREDSLNRLIDDNSMQFSYDSKSVECEVEINVDLEKLHISLQQLTAEELDIITKVFFENMTEREIAKMLGISQVAVNKRKHRILENLKNHRKLKIFCFYGYQPSHLTANKVRGLFYTSVNLENRISAHQILSFCCSEWTSYKSKLLKRTLGL